MRPPTNPVPLILLVLIASVSFAQPAETEAPTGPAEFKGPEPLAFPYVAEITGTDVYIRSGPGSNYYRCGKLNKPDRITVAAHEYSWSKILPPPECFSWISTQYVRFDLNDPTVGIVTGNKVRIWAGSVYLEPIHSTRLQTRLNVGDTVKLLGEEKAGYYKIVPPPDTYFYVSTEFTRYLGRVAEVKPPEVEIKAQPAPERPPAPPRRRAVGAAGLKEYYDLAKKVDIERKKPIAQQNYLEIKKALQAIANDPKSGKAVRYAGLQLEAVGRFESALDTRRQVKIQDAKLTQVRQQIRARLKQRLEKVPDLGRFAAVGSFRKSQIYTALAAKRRFVIIDESGKRICYAQPEGPAAAIDLSEFLDKKVGLLGAIEPDPQTSAALVRFTEIIPIK